MAETITSADSGTGMAQQQQWFSRPMDTTDISAEQRANRHAVKRVVQIAPAERWPSIDFGEIWAYRGLLLLLVWRDVKSRYSQTVLGGGWAVLQPVLTMIVFTFIFGRFARIPSDGVPYPVFSLAALVPWSYFASALSGSSGSLVLHRNLLVKVYFPRLVIPAAPVLAALVDFSIAFGVLLLVMLGFGILPGIETVVMLPLLLLVVLMTALGTGYWLAALNVQYRDVRHVSPFLVQIWMYASPIVYPMSLVPEAYRAIYALNPMAGVISAFRAMLLGTPGPTPGQLGLSLIGGIVILVAGAIYFRHTERVFADVV
jgi:lipopolysaccharide transport system permease protein